jgi:hypothetical protein
MAAAEVAVAMAAAEAGAADTVVAVMAAAVTAKIINRALIHNFKNPFHLFGEDFFYHEFGRLHRLYELHRLKRMELHFGVKEEIL